MAVHITGGDASQDLMRGFGTSPHRGAHHETIQFQPHYKTLTETGKSHFNTPSHALAEFVDNSIMASVNNGKKIQIDINIYKGQEGFNSYIMIADQGSGMNTGQIETFATYSYDTASRGLDDTTSFGRLGKFGVGAKQAGFYLADTITILTRTNENRRIQNHEVLEFELDRETMEERWQNKENPYSGNVNTVDYREPTSSYIRKFNDKRLQEDVKVLEKNSDSFCAIVLTLRYLNAEMLKQKDEYIKTLANEIANIYHWYLHPKHLPNEFVMTDRMKTPPDGISHRPRPLICSIDEEIKPIEIVMKSYEDEEEVPTEIKLSELETSMQLFFNKASAVYRFDVYFDDPNYVPSHVSSQGRDRKLTAQVLILYYGFNQQDSRPSGYEKADLSHRNSEDIEDVVLIDGGKNDSIFSTCWSQRWASQLQRRW